MSLEHVKPERKKEVGTKDNGACYKDLGKQFKVFAMVQLEHQHSSTIINSWKMGLKKSIHISH